MKRTRNVEMSRRCGPKCTIYTRRNISRRRTQSSAWFVSSYVKMSLGQYTYVTAELSHRVIREDVARRAADETAGGALTRPANELRDIISFPSAKRVQRCAVSKFEIRKSNLLPRDISLVADQPNFGARTKLRTSKGHIPLRYLGADRSEAGRRPAISC